MAFEALVIFENTQSDKIRSVSSEGELREVIRRIEGDQDTGFTRTGGTIAREDWFCLAGKRVDAARLQRKHLSHDYSLSTAGFIDGIDRGHDSNASLRIERVKQEYVVAVDHQIVHGGFVLLPHRTVVQSRVQFGSIRYDFAYGRSDVGAFPFETWRRIMLRHATENIGARVGLRPGER